MILIVGLIFAGGFVGWIVGHHATPGHTKPVTVGPSGHPPDPPARLPTAPPHAHGHRHSHRHGPAPAATVSE